MQTWEKGKRNKWNCRKGFTLFCLLVSKSCSRCNKVPAATTILNAATNVIRLPFFSQVHVNGSIEGWKWQKANASPVRWTRKKKLRWRKVRSIHLPVCVLCFAACSSLQLSVVSLPDARPLLYLTFFCITMAPFCVLFFLMKCTLKPCLSVSFLFFFTALPCGYFG